MPVDKKSSDLSSRLKRPGKISSRSTKSTATSSISAPPKAAIASGKAKKEDIHRFNEMLLHKAGNKDSGSGTSTPRELEPGHGTTPSMTSIQDMQGAETAGRVAELERAFAASLEEQNALRDELEKVRQHGMAYRATIEDYRRQLSGTYNHHSRQEPPMTDSTQMDYEQDVEPGSPLDRQADDLIQQNYTLRRELTELQAQLLEQDVLYRGKLEQMTSKGESEWNELTGKLHRSEKESQERLQQLLDLKHSISALTRMESQVTDSELAEKTDQLYHRIREWVINNFRRTKLGFAKLPPETVRALESIHPHYTKIGSTDRLALYQSIVSSTIMYLFREPICIGLPESGPLAPIRQIAAYLHDAGSDYREWRRTTIRALEKNSAKQQLQDEKQKLLQKLCSQIQQHLFSLTSTNMTLAAQATLMSILSAAADLQHTMLLQKAQYKVHFFRNQDRAEVLYDENKMDAINDDAMDEESFVDRKFDFCVFPLLEKFGDEVGENLEVRNVLLKARVCCGVG